MTTSDIVVMTTACFSVLSSAFGAVTLSLLSDLRARIVRLENHALGENHVRQA